MQQIIPTKYIILLSCVMGLYFHSNLNAMEVDDIVQKELIAFNVQQINVVSHGTGVSYTGFNNKGGIMQAACYNGNLYQASVRPDSHELIGCAGKIYTFLAAQYKKQQDFLKSQNN